jgi:beta-galactosidase
MGVRLDLAAGLERVAYFGRGPGEAYSDRKAATWVDRFETTVSETYVPYVMPQEHGHRIDARWLEIRADNRSGAGLRIEGQVPFEFNVGHYTAEDLYQAKHTTDLDPRATPVLYLDAAHRGLGTASCGPDTREPYRLKGKTFQLGYVLSPLG